MSNLIDIPHDKKQLVDIILKTTDLYKVLHVTREATTAEISRQYKKVSVRVHPDKNEHPKASDAFKKVGEAKRILTDEAARRRYDQTGSTSDRPEFTYASPFGSRGHGGPFGDDIFEAFFRQAQHQQQYARSRRRGAYDPFGGDDGGPFGGPFGQAGPGFSFFDSTNFQQQSRRRSSADHSGFSWAPLLMLFIIFIGASYFTTRLATPTAKEFSLWKTQTFSVPHHTVDGLHYWLEPGKFDSDTLLNDAARRALDQRVTEAWRQLKQHQCSQDLAQPKRPNAPSRPPSCVELDRMSSLGRRT